MVIVCWLSAEYSVQVVKFDVGGFMSDEAGRIYTVDVLNGVSTLKIDGETIRRTHKFDVEVGSSVVKTELYPDDPERGEVTLCYREGRYFHRFITHDKETGVITLYELNNPRSGFLIIEFEHKEIWEQGDAYYLERNGLSRGGLFPDVLMKSPLSLDRTLGTSLTGIPNVDPKYPRIELTNTDSVSKQISDLLILLNTHGASLGDIFSVDSGEVFTF